MNQILVKNEDFSHIHSWPIRILSSNAVFQKCSFPMILGASPAVHILLGGDSRCVTIDNCKSDEANVKLSGTTRRLLILNSSVRTYCRVKEIRIKGSSEIQIMPPECVTGEIQKLRNIYIDYGSISMYAEENFSPDTLQINRGCRIFTHLDFLTGIKKFVVARHTVSRVEICGRPLFQSGDSENKAKKEKDILVELGNHILKNVSAGVNSGILLRFAESSYAKHEWIDRPEVAVECYLREIQVRDNKAVENKK